MTEQGEHRVIGRAQRRFDAEARVRGECEFVEDVSFPNMLHCKVLRSPYAHARIKAIDATRARALPGVKAVITQQDAGGRRVVRFPAVHPSFPDFTDAHVLESEVRYVGDRVAAVAATDLEIAEQALALIDLEYEPLPAVFDIVEAIEPGAPVVNAVRWMGDAELPNRNNTNTADPMEGVPSLTSHHVGDVEEGFRRSDLVLENEFRTGRQHQAPLGRPCCVCRPLPGGGLEVWNHTQGIFPARRCLAATLGMPLSKIVIHHMPMGGAFGSYIYLYLTDAICALLALETGLPVRLQTTREEMVFDGGRQPFVIKLKTGVMRDGTLMAMDMSTLDGVGAYGPAPGMNMLAMGFFLSKYRCPNKRYDGHSVYTNTPPLGAMRGAGNPEIHFAIESQMDIIAAKLELDPLELRLRNHPREGDIFIGQSIDISCEIQSCGAEELIREGAKRIGWENREARTPYPDRPWIKRGIGMASGLHTSGAGCPTPSVVMTDYSGAIVKMNEDGTANLTIAAADFGSGNRSAVAAIVAEELGLRYEDVIVSRADTENALYEFITHASRSVYSVGSAARAAAGEAKRALVDLASRMSEVPPEQLEVADGQVFSKTDPPTRVSVAEVLGYAQSQNLGEPVGTASHRSTSCPPHFVATFVEVDVDTLTGELRVVRVVHGGDPGTPIDVDAIRGQLIGGLHQGLGYALTEHLVYDSEDGRVLNPTFKDYKLLPPTDLPTVETFLATTWEPTGPFGAKGIGEGCLNPVAPAVYNAVTNAIGVRIFDMPLTPEKILRAQEQKNDDHNEATSSE